MKRASLRGIVVVLPAALVLFVMFTLGGLPWVAASPFGAANGLALDCPDEATFFGMLDTIITNPAGGGDPEVHQMIMVFPVRYVPKDLYLPIVHDQ